MLGKTSLITNFVEKVVLPKNFKNLKIKRSKFVPLSVSEIRGYTLILKDVSEISRRGPTTLLSGKVIFKILGRGLRKPYKSSS